MAFICCYYDLIKIASYIYNSVLFQITTPKEAFRKTWSAKYTLRSHFDGVRALAFHPTEPVLITASEDQTLKLWNLQKTVPAKKSAALDVEPVYTFRYLLHFLSCRLKKILALLVNCVLQTTSNLKNERRELEKSLLHCSG